MNLNQQMDLVSSQIGDGEGQRCGAIRSDIPTCFSGKHYNGKRHEWEVSPRDGGGTEVRGKYW